MAGSSYKILFCILYLKSRIGDCSVISEPQGTLGKKVEKQKTSVSQCQNTRVSICSQRHLWLNPDRKGRWRKKRITWSSTKAKWKQETPIWDYAWGHQLVLYFSDGLSYTESCWACQSSLEDQHVEPLETADWNPDHTALGSLCADRDVGNRSQTAVYCLFLLVFYIWLHCSIFPLHLPLGKALQPQWRNLSNYLQCTSSKNTIKKEQILCLYYVFINPE